MSMAKGPEKRFAVDIMLGKLAKWLRVLGFDARSMPLNESLVYSLLSRGFIPVTRTVRLSDMDGVLFIHSDHQFEQLKELISLLSISVDELRPFSRCSICNAELLPVPREAAFGAVPDYIFETASDFRKCPKCTNVYWPGSHRKNMIDKLEELGIEGFGE
jgi:uncharacterized protein